jgi:LPS export ABC transporter protein LptC
MNRTIAVIVLALVVIGCEEKIRPAVVPIDQTEIPSQESWKSTVVFSDSAKLKAILWAGHIAVYAQQRNTLLSDSIHVDFFNEEEQHTSLLTARRGKVNDQTQDLEAYDNVVVTSDSGTVLKSESLFWNNADRKIHTEAFVDISSPTEHIMGQGMVSDQGLKHYRIFKVTGRAVTRE